MRCWGSVLIMLLILGRCCGQQITGLVETPDHKGLPGATLVVRVAEGTGILAYGLTNATGQFFIPSNKVQSSRFLIEVRHIGYTSMTRWVDTTIVGWQQIPPFTMEPAALELKEVVIKRELPVSIRSDTVVYNANRYLTPEVKKVEDLLSNMQGFAVDASGRITYNGKRVEKVLIDGEDLAGKGYQLITKNLNAQFVDKVEVINDFSDNRLLQQVEKSDQVGVNLRIKNKFLNRLSANTELGASVNRRYNAETNGFLLSERTKMFSFVSANNVANDASGNVGVYYDEEGADGATDDPTNGIGVLDIGRVLKPPLNEKYTVNNNDIGGALMLSWRLGPNTKMRAMAGVQDRSGRASSYSDIATFIDQQESWFVGNDMEEKDHSKDLQVKIAMRTDNKKKAIDDYYLASSFRGTMDRFSNITSGDITDSLREQINNGLSNLRFGWNASRAIGNGKIFRLATGIDLQLMDQEFINHSGRYAGLFGLDSSYDKNLQQLYQKRLRFNTEATWGGRKKKFDYRYGISASGEWSTYSGLTSISSKTNDSSAVLYVDMNYLLATALFKGTLTVGKKGRFLLDIKPGIGRYIRGTVENVLFAYDVALQYVHSFSALKFFRAAVSGVQSAPTAAMGYPGPLISGNGNVLGSLVYEGPWNRYQFQTSYNVNHIYRQLNWSVNLSIGAGAQQYNHFITAKPEYTIDYLRRSGGNYNAFFIFNLEKYLREVSGKLGVKLFASDLRNRIIVNSQESASINRGFQAECWWISGFRMPVNIESRLKANLNSGKWANEEENSVWQFGLSQKLKWKVSKSFYSSIIWTVNRMSPQFLFQGLDLFMTNKFRNFSMSVRGHNLFNTGRIIESSVQSYSSTNAVFRLNARYILLSISWQW